MSSQQSLRIFRMPANNEDSLTLEQLLERDKDKLGELARLREQNQVAPEEMLIAEFGLYYGYEAMLSVMNNEITYKQMSDLTLAARKIEGQKRYNRVIDAYAAHIATKAKKPHNTITKYLKEISKQWQ